MLWAKAKLQAVSSSRPRLDNPMRTMFDGRGPLLIPPLPSVDVGPSTSTARFPGWTDRLTAKTPEGAMNWGK